MTTELRSPAEQFMSTVRSVVGWADSGSDRVAELDRLLGTIVDPSFPGALIPAVVSHPNPHMVYYALAHDDLEWRQFQPLLLAAVGITYSDFVGIAESFTPETGLEKILASGGYSRVVKFSAHGNRQLGTLLQSGLLRLVDSLITRPTTPDLAVTTTPQLIRNLDMALRYGDRESCEQLLADISDNLRLDAMNIRFLRTRTLAMFGEWQELVQEPFFHSLVETRRPELITTDLITAIYRTQLSTFERSGDSRAALDYYRGNVAPTMGSLLVKIPTNPSHIVLKTHLLSELSALSVDRVQVEHLETLAGGLVPTEKSFFDSLLDLLPNEIPSVVPSGFIDAQLAILNALEKPNDENRRSAIETVDSLAIDERIKLFAGERMVHLWEEIIGDPEKRSPGSWAEWLEAAPSMDYQEARETAEAGSMSWPIEDHLRSAESVTHLVGLLESPRDEDLPKVYQALPFLVDWIKTDSEWPNVSLVPLYRQVLFLLQMGAGSNRQWLSAIADLFTGLLQIDPKPDEYRSTLSDLTNQMRVRVTHQDIDWLIDMSELTLAYPSHDDGIRDEFLGAAATRFNDLISWTTREQAELLRSLLEVVDLAELVELPDRTAPPVDQASTTSNERLSVAIYTLTEPVSTRASHLLESRYPNLNVEVNHDKTNTAKLTSLAQNVDLFIICWNSAKHAATNAIQDIRRPGGLATDYATGTSSVVRAVERYVRSR